MKYRKLSKDSVTIDVSFKVSVIPVDCRDKIIAKENIVKVTSTAQKNQT